MASQKNPCLCAVLKYMEPNLRFMLSARAPQLRPFNTSTPIHLQYLEFEPLQTTINNHTYQLSVVKEWHPGHTEYGPCETLDQDLDQFGFEMDPDRLDKLQGDVDLRESGPVRFTRSGRDRLENSEFMEMEAERRVRFYESLLAKKLELESQENDMVKMFENAMDIGKEQEPEDLENLIPPNQNPLDTEDPQLNRSISILLANRTSQHLQILLSSAKARYLPYQCRRSNLAPPYTLYLQLTLSWPTGIEHYRMKYSMKLNEALKKMNSFFFKGRPPLRIKEMVIDPEIKILRIPSGLKFKPSALSTPIEALCPFKAILDRSNLVLNSLTVRNAKPKQLISFYYPGIRYAKTLIIENSFFEKESWTSVLQAISNKNVELKNEGSKFRSEDALGLIKNWLDNGDRTHGTTISFGLKKESTGVRFVKAVKRQWEPEKSKKTYVVLPMKDKKLRLIVSCQELPLTQKQIENPNESRWILKLKIGKAKKH